MLARYHREATRTVLAAIFATPALDEVVAANVGQDSLPSLFGVDGHRHYCDGVLARSATYIAHEHDEIVGLAKSTGHEPRQRAALGRLLHTVQDFYAHTNYVDLWLEQKGAPACVQTAEMDSFVQEDSWDDAESLLGADATLALPSAQVGQEKLLAAHWVMWRDLFYYVPLVGDVMRRVWLPVDSHEALHLDSPDRGQRFYWAMALARRRTQVEYRHAVRALVDAAGSEAVARFHGEAPVLAPQPRKRHPVTNARAGYGYGIRT